jgi:hypothetical protein
MMLTRLLLGLELVLVREGSIRNDHEKAGSAACRGQSKHHTDSRGVKSMRAHVVSICCLLEHSILHSDIGKHADARGYSSPTNSAPEWRRWNSHSGGDVAPITSTMSRSEAALNMSAAGRVD